MSRKRYLTGLLAAVSILVVLGGCAPRKAASGKIRVMASFDAMAEFAKAVGQDKVELATIIPVGIEPHDYEPKAQDLANLSGAAILVYNGMGMEAWIDKALAAVDTKKLVVVEASKGVDPILNEDAEEIAEHGRFDPHVWLSLSGAVRAATNIAEALSRVDPANKAYYDKNLAAFASEIGAIKAEYAASFAEAKRRQIVTGHAAFAYVCRDFGLEQNSVEDVFAEGEPSAKKLKELVDYCRAQGIKTVFAEDMASPEVSKTLAREVGAKVETIYTMEGAEDGKTYLERARDNLRKIGESLRE